MNKPYSVLFFLLVLSTGLSAQFTNTLIDNGGNAEEPSIAINPLNTNEVVAGANAINNYYSADGGATWTKNLIFSNFGNAGDPCVVADSLGNFFYFHLVNNIDRVVCQKSTNGGSSYNNGSYAWNNNSLFEDKEWATADPSTGNLYVTWTQYDSGNNPGPTDSSRIYFSKSADHGASFTNGMRLDKIAGDCVWLDITDPHPLVGANGEVYVTFMDSAGIRFNKSVDFGVTWLANQPLIATCNTRYDGIPGVDRIRSMPYSACDRSHSIYRGNVYVSWSDLRNGSINSDIFFVKSTDGGNTWTQPLKVNTDQSDHHQYRNAMAVDQTNGYIYIVYYDRRNYQNNDSADIYMAKSRDGGDTWMDYKISSSGFLCDANSFDGDYIDISAHNGKVRPIWTRTDNGNTTVWTALYSETLAGIADNAGTGSGAFTVNPNPATTIAAVSFMNDPENVTGYILDAEGKTVASFFANHQREKIIDITDLAAGIYFVKAGGMTKKLVVVK